MEEQRTCPNLKCGSRLFHNKGISAKNGKPYENWKCAKCGFIEWVDLNPKTGKSTPLPTEIEVDMAKRVESKIDVVNKNVLDVKDQLEKLNQYLRGSGA
jgi:ribosomal protein S27AE